jgi:hypothetical protein
VSERAPCGRVVPPARVVEDQGVPAAGDDRALGLRAALRLHRRADGDVHGDTAPCTGCNCCWSPSPWSARGPSRWRPTGSSTARSTPATRAPRTASWSPARCRCARRGSARSSRWSSWRPRPAQLALPGAGADRRRSRWSSTRTASASPNFPHAILALAQAIGPIGAWLAVTGSWSWDAVVLGLAVGIWIGGFDLIYACQDVESTADRRPLGARPAWGVPVAPERRPPRARRHTCCCSSGSAC